MISVEFSRTLCQNVGSNSRINAFQEHPTRRITGFFDKAKFLIFKGDFGMALSRTECSFIVAKFWILYRNPVRIFLHAFLYFLWVTFILLIFSINLQGPLMCMQLSPFHRFLLSREYSRLLWTWILGNPFVWIQPIRKIPIWEEKCPSKNAFCHRSEQFHHLKFSDAISLSLLYIP